MKEKDKTIETGLKTRSAPMTLDDKSRTIELTFATETPVLSRDWRLSPREDGMYYEILGCDPANVRMDRLQTGAPLLDTHDRYSVRGIIGVVEKAQVTEKRCTASVRFSDRADVEPIYRDVQNGIIKNVSTGYRVNTYSFEGNAPDGIPKFRATDWEPSELSLVPVPADPSSQTRENSQEKIQTIILNLHTMTPEPIVPIVEPKIEPIVPEPKVRTAEQIAQDHAAISAAERKRILEIHTVTRQMKLPEEFATPFIDNGSTVDKYREQAIIEWAKNDPNKPITPISMGDDPVDKSRAMMLDSLCNRINPLMVPDKDLKDMAREFKQLSLIEMAKERMQEFNLVYKHMSKTELITRALTTTDYPILLQDAINKTLQRSYMNLPQTWRLIARPWNAADFKTIHAIKFGANLQLSEILEHGEYPAGKPAESQETWNIKTWGMILPITRKTIINDDLNGFARAAEFIGAAVARKENVIMWGLISGNPVMSDGKTLFIANNHKNLATTPGAVSLTTLAAGRTSMRRMTGMDGEPINVTPKYLIVPPEMEMSADQYISNKMLAVESGSINPFAGTLEKIVEPLLTDAFAWYFASEPALIDMLAYSYLDGATGPYTETRYGFEVDGLQIKVRHDFNGAVIDYRGLYKNAGH